MKRLLMSLMIIGAAGAIAIGATYAYFSDIGTSNGNTFAAGSLDLNVNGTNENVVMFDVTNMRPGNQPKRSYNLENVGTINGYIDIESISLTDYENACLSPELAAGDTDCGDPGPDLGELGQVVNLRLFVDYGCDGWISTGDKVFYNDYFTNLPANVDLNEPLNAGDNVCIEALADWWNTPMDNQAQGDSMVLDMTFELAQDTSQ